MDWELGMKLFKERYMEAYKEEKRERLKGIYISTIIKQTISLERR